jgi:hypothetical protein
VDKADGFVIVFHQTEVITANADRCYIYAGPAKRTQGYFS